MSIRYFKGVSYSMVEKNCPVNHMSYGISLLCSFLSFHLILSPHPGMRREGPWQWPPPTTPCLTPHPMGHLTPPWCGAHWNPQTPPNPGAWAACGLPPHYGPRLPSATRRWDTEFICSVDTFMSLIQFPQLNDLVLPFMYRILVKVLRVWRSSFLSVSLRGNSRRRNLPWGRVCKS